MRASRLGLFAVLTALAACGGDPPPAALDAGVLADAPATSPDAAASAPDAGERADAGPPASFATPAETWTYVPIPGGSCANGSTYGVAVNRSERSSRVLVYLQGGGACWDEITCYLLGLASHINDTLSDTDVLDEARTLEPLLFSRDAARSPFADATFVYLPYCTGDVHAGDRDARYGAHDTHHAGARNVNGVIAALRTQIASPERLWLVGESAGGYGVLVNWWRFREAFADARVDVLDDSGPPVDISAARWEQMIPAWNATGPADCPSCLGSLSAITRYYADHATDGDRFALLQYTQDDTIRTYTSLSAAELEAGVRAYAERAAATSSQRVFVLNGASHVVLTDPTRTSAGVNVWDWVRTFATDGPGWNNVVP